MRRITVAVVIVLLCASAARADGLRFVNGRLDEGPVTVLKLSPDQLLQVRTKRVVVLTEKQQGALRKQAGVGPTVLSVYSTKAAAAGIDSCFEYNMAVWFDAGSIEVPHRLLVSDDQAAAKAEDFDSID